MTEVVPRVYIEDARGEITDPERYFKVAIYACPAGRSLTVSDIVANSCMARIPVSIAGGKALKIGCSVDELSPLLALTANGSILTVGGTILLARK